MSKSERARLKEVVGYVIDNYFWRCPPLDGSDIQDKAKKMNKPTKTELSLATKYCLECDYGDTAVTDCNYCGDIAQALADYRVVLAKVAYDEYTKDESWSAHYNNASVGIAKAIESYGADS